MKHTISQEQQMKTSQKKQFIDNLFVAHQGCYHKLRANDILWINSQGNYAHINTMDQEYVNRISLTNILKRLPNKEFVKIHKCFVVRLDAINHIDRTNSEVLVGDKRIPIGRSYKSDLLSELNLIG